MGNSLLRQLEMNFQSGFKENSYHKAAKLIFSIVAALWERRERDGHHGHHSKLMFSKNSPVPHRLSVEVTTSALKKNQPPNQKPTNKTNPTHKKPMHLTQNITTKSPYTSWVFASARVGDTITLHSRKVQRGHSKSW